MTGGVTVDEDGSIQFGLPRLQSDPAVVFFLSMYKGSDLLGLEYNGVAWVAGAIGDTSIPFSNGKRNVTSQFACLPSTTCRDVVNIDGHATEVPCSKDHYPRIG